MIYNVQVCFYKFYFILTKQNKAILSSKLRQKTFYKITILTLLFKYVCIYFKYLLYVKCALHSSGWTDE